MCFYSDNEYYNLGDTNVIPGAQKPRNWITIKTDYAQNNRDMIFLPIESKEAREKFNKTSTPDWVNQ